MNTNTDGVSAMSAALGVLPAPVATIANDGHPRHIGHVWGIGETRLYGPPRNLYREDQLKAYAAAAVAAERERCARMRTVAEQVLRDMQAQGVLIEWQTLLEEALLPNTEVDRASGSGRTQS